MFPPNGTELQCYMCGTILSKVDLGTSSCMLWGKGNPGCQTHPIH